MVARCQQRMYRLVSTWSGAYNNKPFCTKQWTRDRTTPSCKRSGDSLLVICDGFLYASQLWRLSLFPLCSKYMKSCKTETTKQCVRHRNKRLNKLEQTKCCSGSNHNEEQSSKENRLEFHVQVEGEVYPEVVCVRERLLHESCPLLAYLPYFFASLRRIHLERER